MHTPDPLAATPRTTLPHVNSATREKYTLERLVDGFFLAGTIRPMLNYVRLVSRLIGFGAISLCAFLEFCLIGHWLRGAVKIRYQGRWLSRYSKAICWLVNLKITRIGEPAPAGLLVSNHMSYIDPFLLASQTPVIFVAKHDIRDWPWGGILTRCGGTLYINREQRTDVGRITEGIRTIAEAGVPVGLFLEGTTTDGSHVLPFHPGLLQPAVEIKTNVLPCVVNYRVKETGSPDGISWHGTMTMLPHLLQLLQYSSIEAEVIFNPVVAATDRKRLAATLHQDISRQLVESRERLKIHSTSHNHDHPPRHDHAA